MGATRLRPIGDAIFAVFENAGDAIRAMVAAQLALQAHAWPEEMESTAGYGSDYTPETPTSTGDDYIGLAVHQACHISDAGHGGQILLSSRTAEMATPSLPPDVTLNDLGVHRLRDIVEPQTILEVVHPDLPRVEAPLRTLSARPNNIPVQLTSFVGRDRETQNSQSPVAPRGTSHQPGRSRRRRKDPSRC